MCEREGIQGPWRRGATRSCRLSRQLLVRRTTSSYSGLCLRSGLILDPSARKGGRTYTSEVVRQQERSETIMAEFDILISSLNDDTCGQLM